MSNTAASTQTTFATNPRREELKALSNELKSFAFEAETTINAVLVAHYADFTGKKSETFKTLEAWNAEGFQVKKGEHSFIIWGRPEKKTLNKSEGLNGQEAEVTTFYKMVHLFHVGQVVKRKEKQSKESKSATPEESTNTKQRKVTKKRA